MREHVTIISVRVEDLPKAHVPSHKEECKDCGKDVWVDNKIPEHENAVCVRCIVESGELDNA